MNNVPKLRFKGFEEEWEEKRLGDFTSKITNKNKNFVVRNIISNSARNGLISQRDFFDKDIANQNNIDGYYIIENGDFVYNPRRSIEAPYGPINMFTQKEAGVVSPLYFCFRCENINGEYLKRYFKSSKWHKYIHMNSDQGARHDRVSIRDSEVLNMDIKLPVLKEQEKIANFLSKVDKLIEKQEEKTNNLEKYKKGMMQKIFSQEIRFKDDDGGEYPEWEEKRMSEVSDSFDYGMNSAAIEFDGENKYIRITDIDERSSKYKNDNIVSPDGELSDKYLVNENDILFARTGASVGKSYIYDKDDGKLYFAGFLIRAKINKNNNAKYIYLQTKTEEYKKWVEIMSMRSGQPGINSQEYASYKIKLPKIEEQNKIANYLSKIDLIIEKEKEKLEELRKWKKGLLQQMFV